MGELLCTCRYTYRLAYSQLFTEELVFCINNSNQERSWPEKKGYVQAFVSIVGPEHYHQRRSSVILL